MDRVTQQQQRAFGLISDVEQDHYYLPGVSPQAGERQRAIWHVSKGNSTSSVLHL